MNERDRDGASGARVGDTFLKAVGHAALNNSIALVALVVASVSLYLTLADREEAKRKELLVLTMSVQVVESANVVIEDESAGSVSPFRGPYLMLPVRLFIMNGSSVPQAITDLWLSFDVGPDDKLRFVPLEKVRETDGAVLRWPKTIPPREAVAFEAVVPIPLESEVIHKLGYQSGVPETAQMGPAGRLFITLSERTGSTDWVRAHIRQPATFSLRLLSTSPGSPNQVTLREELP